MRSRVPPEPARTRVSVPVHQGHRRAVGAGGRGIWSALHRRRYDAGRPDARDSGAAGRRRRHQCTALQVVDLNAANLRVGALVRMSELAAHPGVRQQVPMIAQALELSASAQLRNMASIGGNLMQRPRCLYFRDVSAACNRRTPGTGCAAIGGRNRTHAILGTSEQCVATHPSDLAVALVALDAVVVVRDRGGERRIRLSDFFRQPGRHAAGRARSAVGRAHRGCRRATWTGIAAVRVHEGARPRVV